MDRARSKVLLALDGSPAAAMALPIAQIVATQLGATLEILFVNTTGKPLIDPRRYLGLGDLAVDVNVVDSGAPGAAILNATQDPRVQLVVLTTHGRIVQMGRHLGRVATAVIAGASQPILLVRPEVAASADHPPAELRHLLVPLDGTPTTSKVLGPAADLARRLGASIDLLHVAAPCPETSTELGTIAAPHYVDQPQHEWPVWCSEVADRVAAVGTEFPTDVPIHVFLAYGPVGREIVDFAAKRHIDAIVVARRSHLQPGRAPVLRAILDQAPCPIILVGPTSTPRARLRRVSSAQPRRNSTSRTASGLQQ